MFNPGDIVVCIEPRDHLVINKRYKVEYVRILENEPMVKIEEAYREYYAYRFKLAEDQKELKMENQCPFKVGDKVIVTHKVDDLWVDDMDVAINNEYIVKKLFLGNPNRIYLDIDYGDGRIVEYIFNVKALKLVKKLITYKEWYNEAKKKGIVNRSKMNKAQLIEAVKAWKAPPIVLPPLGDVLRKRVGNGESCCHFAKEFEGGRRVFYVTAPCHANLRGAPKVITLVDDIGSHYNRHHNKEWYIKFVNYMLNESPWKDQFLTKNAEEAIEHGVYYDVHKGYNRVGCSAVALRQGSEYPNRIDTFKFFCEKGFSNNVSWCLSQLVEKDYKWRLSMIHGAHDVFINYMSKEKFFKFFKEGFFNMERCSYFEADNLAYTFAGAIAPGDVQDQYLNNRLHKNETITEFVAKQIPCKVEGNGWNQQVVIKEEDVIAFANLVKGILE